MSKKSVFLLLLLAGAVAALAMYRRRRSGEDLESWDSLAGDASARPGMVDVAKDVAKKASDAAKGMAAKASNAAEQTSA